MKQNRLAVLLVVMVALLVFRWLVPPGSGSGDVATAVVRAPSPATEPVAQAVARMVAESKQVAVPVAEADAEAEVPGNAFAVRLPPAPAPEPTPPRPPRASRVKTVAVVETPAPVVAEPPPPPPPPLQVIGTWNDGGPPAVFLAGPLGTLIARPGTVLLSEYRVTGIDARNLSLIHVVSQHQWQLPIPQVQARP